MRFVLMLAQHLSYVCRHALNADVGSTSVMLVLTRVDLVTFGVPSSLSYVLLKITTQQSNWVCRDMAAILSIKRQVVIFLQAVTVSEVNNLL